MMMAARGFKLCCISFILLAASSSVSHAQQKTVTRIIVPFAAGGTNDVVARILADRLPALLGKPVVVENRPGAGGNQGAEAVFNADADGDMLLVSPMPLLTINPHVYKDMRFDPMKFAAISILVRYPVVLVARSSLPVSDAAELVTYARQIAGKLTYASQGVGTIGHVAFERFADTAAFKATHVPYRGNGPAINDLMGGHVDVLLTDLIGVLPGIQEGRLKLLGTSGERRLDAFSTVPTLAEIAPGIVINSWIGLVTTPGTPVRTVEMLSEAVGKSFADPAVRSQLAVFSAVADGKGPMEMRAAMVQESKVWSLVLEKQKAGP